MAEAKRADYYGTCSNCGHVFYPNGTHGAGCGCGYPLSAHEQSCWGKDGRTPHPLNAALAPEELQHRRRAVAAKRAATRNKAILTATPVGVA